MTDAAAAGEARLVPRGLLESALYVDDLGRARAFYEEVVGLRPLFADARLVAMEVGGNAVLLLFARGGSTRPAHLPGGTIPPHDGSGPLHMAFSVSPGDLERWERRFAACGIPIESTVEWPRGGKSLYVRDPDGHLVEFATPNLWFREPATSTSAREGRG